MADRRQAVIQARRPAEVLPVLAAVEAAAASGLWAAGFVTYEAASGVDEDLTVHESGELPLVCFGVFSRPEFH